jgi:hypothetical protein
VQEVAVLSLPAVAARPELAHLVLLPASASASSSSVPSAAASASMAHFLLLLENNLKIKESKIK